MKKMRYKIERVHCYNCGDLINPETEESITLIKDEYKLYFCNTCSEKGIHVVEANSHAAGTVPSDKSAFSIPKRKFDA